MILHIDMDAFFASIEQAINPKLKGKPLIVGSRANKLYTVVCAASYEAKAYGIDSGMPTKEAFQLCPNLEFVPAEQSKYIWTSEQIFELLKGYGFEVVYASIDEFDMDIAGQPQPEALARDIQKSIQEALSITASIGIAKNYLLAKLASKINKPRRGLAIITETNLSQILAKIPVEKLCGVGQKSTQFFTNLGVKTVLDLYQALHSMEKFDPQTEGSKPKSIGHSYTFPRASETPGFIQAWIRLLSEMVGRRLRQQNLLARGDTVHLWLECPEMGHFGAQKSFHSATDERREGAAAYEIYSRCLKIRAKLGQKLPKVRALGVACSNLFEASYPALFKEQKRREELIKAVDKINSCHGEDTIYPAVITLTRKLR